jgi:hypothetical protein
VVAGDVVVQIFPHALDAVVIGAVRRQEVQTYSAACRRQRQACALAVVDLEIVQHHVNASGPRITAVVSRFEGALTQISTELVSRGAGPQHCSTRRMDNLNLHLVKQRSPL